MTLTFQSPLNLFLQGTDFCFLLPTRQFSLLFAFLFKVLHWSIIYITVHALRCAFQWVLLNVYTHVTTSQIKIQYVPITLEVLSCILSVNYLFNWSPAAAATKLHQSCPTLCNPIDGSPPGSPVPGILQAGTLEWVAISFSNAWKWKVKVKSLSHVLLFVTPWIVAHQTPPSMGFPRQEYWSGVPLPSPKL